MYVKIVKKAVNPNEMSTNIIFDVGREVHQGVFFADGTYDEEPHWPSLLKIEDNATAHIVGLELNQHGNLDKPVGWAWWWKERVKSAEFVTPGAGNSIEYVITQGNMYILNDDGRTIEKVL